MIIPSSGHRESHDYRNGNWPLGARHNHINQPPGHNEFWWAMSTGSDLGIPHGPHTGNSRMPVLP